MDEKGRSKGTAKEELWEGRRDGLLINRLL